MNRHVSEYELAAQMRRMEWIVRAGFALAVGVVIGLILTALGIWQ